MHERVNAKLTEFTLRIEYYSYHITSSKKSSLIQNPSAFHQHGVAEKKKNYRFEYFTYL